MLTGQKAFTGKSQASLIGSIMNSDPPPISSIQPMIPASLDRIVKGCLAKEPEHRWSTAHDVMLQLQWIAEGGSMAGVPAPVVARRKNREKLAWALLRGGPARRRGARGRVRAPRAEARAAGALRHRSASRDRDDRRAAHLAGRPPARVRRDRHGGEGAHLGAAAQLADRAAADGHRWRRSPLLVAGQPLHRIHRRRRDEEGRRHRAGRRPRSATRPAAPTAPGAPRA